jgi:hypothetical protein
MCVFLLSSFSIASAKGRCGSFRFLEAVGEQASELSYRTAPTTTASMPGRLACT